MGADEAGTARAVREHREAAAPIFASLGGRLGSDVMPAPKNTSAEKRMWNIDKR